MHGAKESPNLIHGMTPSNASLILMWCKVSHHPSLRWVSQFQFYVMWTLTHHSSLSIVSHILALLIVMWCKLTHHPSLSIITILFVRNLEDCFPTSFDDKLICTMRTKQHITANASDCSWSNGSQTGKFAKHIPMCQAHSNVPSIFQRGCGVVEGQVLLTTCYSWDSK